MADGNQTRPGIPRSAAWQAIDNPTTRTIQTPEDLRRVMARTRTQSNAQDAIEDSVTRDQRDRLEALVRDLEAAGLAPMGGTPLSPEMAPSGGESQVAPGALTAYLENQRSDETQDEAQQAGIERRQAARFGPLDFSSVTDMDPIGAARATPAALQDLLGALARWADENIPVNDPGLESRYAPQGPQFSPEQVEMIARGEQVAPDLVIEARPTYQQQLQNHARQTNEFVANLWNGIRSFAEREAQARDTNIPMALAQAGLEGAENLWREPARRGEEAAQLRDRLRAEAERTGSAEIAAEADRAALDAALPILDYAGIITAPEFAFPGMTARGMSVARNVVRNVGDTVGEVGIRAAPRVTSVTADPQTIAMPAQQRWAAGVRDPQTGQVYTGMDHADAIDNAPLPVQARLRSVYEPAEDPASVGFVIDGEFMPRERGMARLGEIVRRSRLNAGFDGSMEDSGPGVLNEIIDYLRGRSPRAVAQEVASARQAVRANPQTLTQWVRRQGGIRDDRGDVGAFAGDQRGFGRIVNANSGRYLDDLANAAWEEGFFPNHAERPTVNEFIDALRGDFTRQAPVVADQGILEQAGEARSLLDALSEAGVDVGARGRQLENQIRTASAGAPLRDRIGVERPQTQGDRLFSGVDPTDGDDGPGLLNRLIDRLRGRTAQADANAPDAGARGGGQADIEQLRAQGFNVDEPLFHGTGADIDGPLRPTVDHPRGTAVYTATNRDMAQSYADSARGGNPNVVEMYARGRVASEQDWHHAYAEANPAGASGSNIDKNNRAVALLRERGFSGVRDGQEVAVWNPSDLVRAPARPDGGAAGARIATPAEERAASAFSATDRAEDILGRQVLLPNEARSHEIELNADNFNGSRRVPLGLEPPATSAATPGNTLGAGIDPTRGLVRNDQPSLLERIAFLLRSATDDRRYGIGRYLDSRRQGGATPAGEARTGEYRGVYSGAREESPQTPSVETSSTDSTLSAGINPMRRAQYLEQRGPARDNTMRGGVPESPERNDLMLRLREQLGQNDQGGAGRGRRAQGSADHIAAILRGEQPMPDGSVIATPYPEVTRNTVLGVWKRARDASMQAEAAEPEDVYARIARELGMSPERARALSARNSTTNAGVNPARNDLDARVNEDNPELPGGAPGTEALRIPDDANEWRTLVGQHPWINSPSRAQLLIMYHARLPNGGKRYSMGDIANGTGYTLDTVPELLYQARQAGVAIPNRPPGSRVGVPEAGDRIPRILDLMEKASKRGERLSGSAIAERLGLTRGNVNTTLSQLRSGARGTPELRERLRALERRTNAGVDAQSILPWLATGGYFTGLNLVAQRGQERQAAQHGEAVQ